MMINLNIDTPQAKPNNFLRIIGHYTAKSLKMATDH